MSTGSFAKFRLKAISTVKRSGSGILISIEIIAAVTAIIALFDFMFSKRSVPYFSGNVSACIASPDVEEQVRLRDFVQQNRGRYVYLSLSVQPEPSGGFINDFRKCSFDDGRLSLSLGLGGVFQNIWLPASAAINASPTQDQAQLYAIFERSQFDSRPLATFNVTESLFGGINISGLFFNSESYGEGDVYVELIPAPLLPETERLSRCTPAINESSFWQLPRRYFSSCLF